MATASRPGHLQLDFVGIGMAKAATTWLAACLRDHPQVCLPEQKELNYFCTTYVIWPQTATYYREGEQWLQQHFAHWQPGQLRGEISPNYLLDPTSPGLLQAHNPDMLLFVSYRNPVDGLYALYHELAKRRAIHDDFQGFLARYPRMLDYGRLYSNTQRFLDRFPQQNFHFMLFEDIVMEPEVVLRKLYQFLGLSPDYTPASLHERINPRQGARYLAVRDVVSHATDMLNSGPRARRVKNLLRAMSVHRLADWVEARNFQEAIMPPMPEAVRTGLQGLYGQEIAMLSQLLRRDLSHWLGQVTP